MSFVARTGRNPRRLVLAMALCLLPLSGALAQSADLGALKKRLGEAIHAGELTREEAGIMLKALSGANEDSKANKPEKKTDKKTDKKVAKEKQAKEKKQKAEKQAKSARAKGDSEEAKMKLVYEKLGAAIKNGDLTEAEAKAKWAAMFGDKAGKSKDARKRKEAKPKETKRKDRSDEEMAKVRKKLGEAVRQGHLTAEQAREKFRAHAEQGSKSEKEAAKKKVTDKKADKKSAEKQRQEEDLRAITAKLRAAVADGKLTTEEARRKMAEIRKRMANDR